MVDGKRAAVATALCCRAGGEVRQAKFQRVVGNWSVASASEKTFHKIPLRQGGGVNTGLASPGLIVFCHEFQWLTPPASFHPASGPWPAAPADPQPSTLNHQPSPPNLPSLLCCIAVHPFLSS